MDWAQTAMSMLESPTRRRKVFQNSNIGVSCLPVHVRHNGFWDICSSFLHYSNDLERWVTASARMDDDRAAQLRLGMSCCLKDFVFTLSQRPRAANFSYYTTLDVGSVCSMENFINNNLCQLETINILLIIAFFMLHSIRINTIWEAQKQAKKIPSPSTSTINNLVSNQMLKGTEFDSATDKWIIH